MLDTLKRALALLNAARTGQPLDQGELSAVCSEAEALIAGEEPASDAEQEADEDQA